MTYDRAIVWLRRDLRLRDNVALEHACLRSRAVCLAFVASPALLASPRMGAPLVTACFDAVRRLRVELRALGSDLVVLEGDFATELVGFVQRVGAQALFFNDDYEPDAIRRDASVAAACKTAGIDVRRYVDHVYYSADAVVNASGGAYRVFTPYRRAWLARHAAEPIAPAGSMTTLHRCLLPARDLGGSRRSPLPGEFGYAAFSGVPEASERVACELFERFLAPSGAVEHYARDRDVPALHGTSRLSMHLRLGTIGIRECVERAYACRSALPPGLRPNVDAWIAQLVWRDFFQTILKRFPHVATDSYLERARTIRWEHPGATFQAWCEGQTGYPIVDAGMRQLNQTGWMHNRLRMIVASFLTKHLLVDWRHGERYFEQHLLDADLAQNNGGWQWAASTGTDAVPYFRIFNPSAQSRRFDPNGAFVKRFVPELADVSPDRLHAAPFDLPSPYPRPIVDHAAARRRALAVFASAGLEQD